jgi:formylglycine-generating enzyme required for sulfatase activity
MFTSVEFCDWLTTSENGRLPAEAKMSLCYRIDRAGDVITVVPKATGYRLPTVDEWEFACRAGSKMRWCCGEDPRLLTEYSRDFSNAIEVLWPVASAAPNAFGIFDMHGNVGEWTADVVVVDPNKQKSNQYFTFPPFSIHTIRRDDFVAQCGGDIYSRSGLDRCARKVRMKPAPEQLEYKGIRVARSAPKASP